VAGAGKRGRERKKLQKQGVDGLVLADFKLIFFPTQAMKSTPIYRGWKRVFLSSHGEISALDSVGKDLNHWFKVSTMNCQIWQFKAAWVGYFRLVPRSFWW
jgi:hypothetical protein